MRNAVLLLVIAILIFAPVSFAQQDNGDVNCDESVNILDVTYTINYLYKGGPPPCPFIGAGVNYAYDDQADIDIGYTYSTLIFMPVYAPADGWMAFDYSFYADDEAYCMEILLGETRGDGGVPDERATSYVRTFTTLSPITWHQIMPIDSGTTWYAVSVRSCGREDGDTMGDEKAIITFRNINFSATYYPVYYGPMGD